MKAFVVYNVVYLPIDQNWNDKALQKYVKADMNANVYMDSIYTETEIRLMHDDSKLIECNDLIDLVNKWNST